MATTEQITRAILSLRYLPNSPITATNIPEIISTFEIVLADLPAETLDAATRQYLSSETFFPTPGRLREIAMDLQMLAMGVPTPAEAWGMVFTAIKHKEKILCEEGYNLYNTDQKSPEYMKNVWEYGKHLKVCKICDEGGTIEDYQNSAVASTVKLLGGREAIITDNPTADRARFTDAYREVISRERMKTAMLPDVKGYVEEKSMRLGVGGAIKKLTGGMTK